MWTLTRGFDSWEQFNNSPDLLKKGVTYISIQVDLSAIEDNKVAPWYALIKTSMECEQYLKYITIPSLLLVLTKLWLQYMSSTISESIVRNSLFQTGIAVLKTLHIFFIVPYRLLPAPNILIFSFKWKHTGQISIRLNFYWKLRGPLFSGIWELLPEKQLSGVNVFFAPFVKSNFVGVIFKSMLTLGNCLQ